MTWDLSFRDQKGAYQAPVRRMFSRGHTLVFFLENYILFLARRERIRLPIDSRSPTDIVFTYNNRQWTGKLIDFNLEGLGILVPLTMGAEVDDPILDGSFQLRSQQVSFQRARVAHTAFLKEGVRVGLQFTQLTSNQEEIVKEVFDAWFLSQKPSFSVKDEA